MLIEAICSCAIENPRCADEEMIERCIDRILKEKRKGGKKP